MSYQDHPEVAKPSAVGMRERAFEIAHPKEILWSTFQSVQNRREELFVHTQLYVGIHYAISIWEDKGWLATQLLKQIFSEQNREDTQKKT